MTFLNLCLTEMFDVYEGLSFKIRGTMIIQMIMPLDSDIFQRVWLIGYQEAIFMFYIELNNWNVLKLITKILNIQLNCLKIK